MTSLRKSLWAAAIIVIALIALLSLTIFTERGAILLQRIQGRADRVVSQATSTLVEQERPSTDAPTLANYWNGEAEFVVDVAVTGLPMGESETIVMGNGELWSYVHASDRSIGTVDRCGDPVEFPGCVVSYRSTDGGISFTHDDAPVCDFMCNQCPCESQFDHTDQQQYPRVAFDGERLNIVYEYRGMVMYRNSFDGELWSHPELVPLSGMWDLGFMDCTPDGSQINEHPFTPKPSDCLMGGPPGIYVEDGLMYVFVGMGQNPSAMACFVGPANGSVTEMKYCSTTPLFAGATTYGPMDTKGAEARSFFDFRTISSADVQKVGARYYMLYEGVRGPGKDDPGDTQFALGLARSSTDQIDGPWETFDANPILVEMPGNIGVGHADLVVMEGETYLYTSLDGETRSRLKLEWR